MSEFARTARLLGMGNREGYEVISETEIGYRFIEVIRNHGGRYFVREGLTPNEGYTDYRVEMSRPYSSRARAMRAFYARVNVAFDLAQTLFGEDRPVEMSGQE